VQNFRRFTNRLLVLSGLQPGTGKPGNCPPEISETIFMYAFVLRHIGLINQPINVPCFLKLTTQNLRQALRR